MKPGRGPSGRADLMQPNPIPRLHHVDPPCASGVLAAFEQERLDIVDDAAASQRPLSQVEYVMLAEACKNIGMLKYALGHPLSDTAAAFADAARAYLHVFELRGTQPTLEVTLVRGDEARPTRRPGGIDDSLANSRRG